jgi:hypothetical protein
MMSKTLGAPGRGAGLGGQEGFESLALKLITPRNDGA